MAIAETNGPVFRAPAIDVRGVFFFAGVIVCLLGAAMLVPALHTIVLACKLMSRATKDAATKFGCPHTY
jgi:hypothetical protein